MLRGCDGRLVFAFYNEFGEIDVLKAEGLALLEGLQMCATRWIQGIQVEVDSAVLVSLVKSGGILGWRYRNMLRRIRRLLVTLSISFDHAFRAANMVADRLASLRGQDSSMIFGSY